MEFVKEIISLLITFIGGLSASYWGPKAVAKMQGKNKKEEVALEGDKQIEVTKITSETDAEKLYIEATERQYKRYELEIERIEKSFSRRIDEMQKEFDRKFDEINSKYNHVLEEKSFLEKEIELRDDRIEELETENSELKDRVAYLKGEI